MQVTGVKIFGAWVVAYARWMLWWVIVVAQSCFVLLLNYHQINFLLRPLPFNRWLGGLGIPLLWRLILTIFAVLRSNFQRRVHPLQLFRTWDHLHKWFDFIIRGNFSVQNQLLFHVLQLLRGHWNLLGIWLAVALWGACKILVFKLIRVLIKLVWVLTHHQAFQRPLLTRILVIGTHYMFFSAMWLLRDVLRSIVYVIFNHRS